MPKVSVIIPVYNVERYLGECLDSILGQTLKDIEVICVDDGSEDSSREILLSYASRDRRLRVADHEGKGAAAARNQGLDLASGEYVLFCDSDDWLDRDTLSGMHKNAMAGNADVCVTGMRYFDSDTGKEFRIRNVGKSARGHKGAFKPIQLGDSLFCSLRAQTGGKMFRRSFVRALGIRFQDQVRANDIAFVATAMAAAEHIVVDDKAHYHYRKNQGGNLSSKINQFPDMSAMAWLRVRENLTAHGIFEKFRRPFEMAASQALVEVMVSVTDIAVARDFYRRIRDELIPKLGLQEVSSVPAARVFFTEGDPLAFYMETLATAGARHAALRAKVEAWKAHPLAMLIGKLRRHGS